MKRYTNPYIAGTALGVVLYLSYMLTGHGLGASGGIQRIFATGIKAVAPEHVDRTPQWAAIAGGEKNPLDHWLVWAVAGVALGGLVSGALARRVRLQTLAGPNVTPRTRWMMALIGGILVGYAARLARGCTSGQALSGGAVLAFGSWAFMIMVFVGGYTMARPFRKFWN
jgi:hypothetical protein